MQAFVWIVRLLVVVVLVWFAVKNAQPITLHGLPDQSWQAPLVFVLLLAFVGGVVIGLLAWVPTVVRQRRELSKLRRDAETQAAIASAMPPPAPQLDREPPRDFHGV
jgi:lipopolysaccharide assembly protein A